MVSLQSSDRRNFNRIYARLDISICINDQKLDASMQNLSSSGILIFDTVQNEIRKYQECRVIITIDENNFMELEAEAVWIKNGLVGLSFINIDEYIRSDLDRILLRLIKQTVAVAGMEAFA
jgi:c-di-GMP-binding flagellar brake protein YcgR